MRKRWKWSDNIEGAPPAIKRWAEEERERIDEKIVDILMDAVYA